MMKGDHSIMNESYAEYLIKRKTPFYALILTGVLAAVTAVFIFLALTTGVLAVILMFVSGFATYLSYRNTHVEFEYLYVEKQLSVDRILGRAKRKKAYECSMEEIQVIAPADHHVLKEHKTNGKTLDFSSHLPGARVYAAVVQKNGETVKLLLEPSDKMIQCFRQTAPRKVVQ